MALQSIPGDGAWLGRPSEVGVAPQFNSILLDAAADRVVFLGPFRHKDRATKTVDGVGFSFGTVSKGAGSTLQVSLQDVDLTTGPVMQPDGTPDQTLTIANADAGFVSNSWYEAGFDAAATRSLTPGDMIAVVLQFGTFVASDTVNIRGLASALGATASIQSWTVANLSGAYAVQAIYPNIVLRCSDGTYGTIEDGWPCSAITGHSYNLNSATADEFALGIQLPFGFSVDGVAALCTFGGATATTEILLYSGTTPLWTKTVDHNVLTSLGGTRAGDWPVQPAQTGVANTLYRLAIRPTGTTNITMYSFDVANANHFQCHAGGPLWHHWTRLDQGAWGGEVTTRRLFAGVRLSAFDDGVSAGGGAAQLINTSGLVG